MDWSPMLKALFGIVSGSEEVATKPVETKVNEHDYGRYECEYKDSGMVKAVDKTEIVLRCVPGTERGTN